MVLHPTVRPDRVVKTAALPALPPAVVSEPGSVTARVTGLEFLLVLVQVSDAVQVPAPAAEAAEEVAAAGEEVPGPV